jgi:hypothetical protein
MMRAPGSMTKSLFVCAFAIRASHLCLNPMVVDKEQTPEQSFSLFDSRLSFKHEHKFIGIVVMIVACKCYHLNSKDVFVDFELHERQPGVDDNEEMKKIIEHRSVNETSI